MTTSVVAGLMSTEAIAYLAGLRCEPGRVLRYQALPASLTSYRVGADPQRPLTTELAAFYGTSCAVPNTDPADALLQRVASGAAVALDVREPHEKYVADLAQRYRPLRLPLSEITSSADIADALGGAAEAVVFCASGVRSQRVVDTYAAALPQVQLHSLPGGVGALGAADINNA